RTSGCFLGCGRWWPTSDPSPGRPVGRESSRSDSLDALDGCGDRPRGLRSDRGDAASTEAFDLELVGEGVDDLGVELGAGAALELLDRLVGRDAPPVDALGGHGVESIRDEDDPGAERDALAGEAVGVAAAVPALVMVEHPVGDGVDAQAFEHPEADLRMPLEHHTL